MQAISKKYAVGESQLELAGDFTVRHGSTPIAVRRCCAICTNKCSRKCPDCPFSPALSQSLRRDCHGTWDSTGFVAERGKWGCQQMEKSGVDLFLHLDLNDEGDQQEVQTRGKEKSTNVVS